MSLIGIDLGSSAIKVVAFSLDGAVLAEARREVGAHRPQPGWWEVDTHESFAAFDHALASVVADEAVRADPPSGISFSSSGREVFPVDEDGRPLGPCLMTADVRGDEVAAVTAAGRTAREWFALCGHVPRRMDPVNRILWWKKTDPATTARARWFMNWHEYFSLRLTGRPVVDASDAGTWMIYERSTGAWSPERIAASGIDRRFLPEIQASGTVIGPVLPEVAAELGLPAGVLVATGAFDTFASAIGSGAVHPGMVGLACGSWHSFVLPAAGDIPDSIADEGMNLYAFVEPTGQAINVNNPNGMTVQNWARSLTHLSITRLEEGLAAAGPGPGHVWANAHLTPLPHHDVTPGFGGSLHGLTLATSAVDIVRALLESIACDLAVTLDSLRSRGVPVTLIRASGGGSRSAWWMQQTADVCGIPVEVVTQDEPGAFGAALLAGIGAGTYPSVASAVRDNVLVAHRYEPDAARGALYRPLRERLASERAAA
jgi:xylulokinase